MIVAARRVLLRTGCAAAFVWTQSTELEKKKLFSFGILADIQYADIDDASNFGKTEFRYYRQSLEGARKAGRAFQDEHVSFVAQLGDLIDGQNGGTYGAGLGRGRTSEDALTKVLNVLSAYEGPYYHAVGNHELMNFQNPNILNDKFNDQHVIAKQKNYFSFHQNNWTFVMLNAYENSLELPADSEGYKEAEIILRRENPQVVNAGNGKVDFFRGLDGDRQRFVPFNGAYGEKQLQWLQNELDTARQKGHSVVLFSHTPVHPNSASWRNVNYDAPDLLNLLKDYHDVVTAVFAGHSHRGGYYFDAESGISHTTVQAILTHVDSFGIVDVFTDDLRLRGFGALPSRVIHHHESHHRRRPS